MLSAVRFNFSFSAEHIPGVHNEIAEALSRIRWQEFRRLAPADSSPAPVGIDQLSLEQRCHAFLVHGLAPSSRKNLRGSPLTFVFSYASFIPPGRLVLLATFLARFGHHLTIKVYLSRVRALYVEQGFPDTLQNCLLLQRVVRGIKRSQGSPSSNRLPITDSHMLLI